MHFVYMLKNAAGKLYVGISENPDNRLKYHDSRRGALFTKSEDKFFLVFCEQQPTLAAARQREIQIKNWRRSKKEILIEWLQRGLQTRA